MISEEDIERDRTGKFTGTAGGSARFDCPVPTLGEANLRHGMRARSLRLLMVALPRKFKFVERFTNSFRQLVESEVLDRHGEITLVHASIIGTVCQIERARRIVERIFADNMGTVAPEKLVEIQCKTVLLSTQRDAALAKLGLERNESPSKLWDAIDATPASSSRKGGEA